VGNSQTGGGGSVQWKLEVKKLKKYQFQQKAGGLQQNGADQAKGREFTVTIRYFEGTLDEFKGLITMNNGVLRFRLPIADHGNQIEISWPDGRRRRKPRSE
jgi:hypothetical protein